MTRCEEFFAKLEQLKAEGDEEKLREFCDKSYTTMQRIDSHTTFMKKVITDNNLPIGKPLSVISEGATREVRSEPKEIQDKVIPKIQDALKKNEAVTTPQVKQWVNEAKNPDFYNGSIPNIEECKEDVCPTCQPLSLKEEFCPICPKTCDTSATNCPVVAFIKWNGGE